MGLDWVPLGKPKPGHEDEHRRLFERLYLDPSGATDREGSLKASDHLFGRSVELVKYFQSISIEPDVVLGSPRVGRDPAADAWLADVYQRNADKATVPFSEMKAALDGMGVPELAPP